MRESELKSLSDEEVLALTDLRWEPVRSEELSDLLYDQQAATLEAEGRQRLANLMHLYGCDMVRKSQGLAEAVRRGLGPPMG